MKTGTKSPLFGVHDIIREGDTVKTPARKGTLANLNPYGVVKYITGRHAVVEISRGKAKRTLGFPLDELKKVEVIVDPHRKG